VAVARLVPVKPAGRRRFGALKGRIVLDASFNDPLPEDEQAAWDLT
jgi:antitoxin (DNA-binding transcriptional repressor) of toxin-antitoxin stability system